MHSSVYYTAALALGIALTVKLPSLRRHWRNPMVRAVGLLILTGGLGFIFAAPSSISAVNRATGIPNFSGPLVYDFIVAFSAACLLLLIHWRGGPEEHVRRIVRRWFVVYGVVLLAVPLLFALGEAPVERLRDLDSHYARTPFIREMILTYLLAHSVTAAVTIAMCRRWSREVRHWLRRGLVTLIVGFALGLGFGVAKLVAVAAAWAGADWSVLDTSVAPPLAAVGALVVTVGFLLPVAGPRVQEYCGAWRTYWRLGGLAKELNVRNRPGASPRLPWWSSPRLRLTQRETEIHDCLLVLTPHLDPAVRDAAHASALKAGVPRERAADIGAAAMLAAAQRARTAGQPGNPDAASTPVADDLATAISSGPRKLAEISSQMSSAYVTSVSRRPA